LLSCGLYRYLHQHYNSERVEAVLLIDDVDYLLKPSFFSK
jgi:hypothetical protein